ncbi:major histocompatibility complex class I-related gene protein [Oreochromis niloticus]|uniref:major histocompatibility complex class I-related gene protein n=1 Tax=Oreochromis niloticus TaxID=8128 RepID=UPI000904FB31|nr:major histocompatibility complex class I-related gene protein [Oreochromis niloticus]
MAVFLLLLFCSVSSAVKHSLEYLITASSGVPNIPEYMGAMMLDGVQIGYCDSITKRVEPRQDWLKEMLENDTELLEMYTRQCFVIQPNTFGNHISSLKEQFQQSEGVHILQMREGCEWDEKTGEETGFLQYSYNGEDFVEIDLKTLTWIALKPEAAITKQKWDADSVRTNVNKNLFTNIYPKWIKKVLSYGKGSQQRTVFSSVSLLQKSSSSPVSCHATGFCPNRGLLFWRKDGKEIHEGVNPGEILPNNDGTFQISVDLNVSSVKPEDWRRYDCVFQFSDVEDIIVTKLDKPVIRTNRGKNKISNDQETLPDMMIPVIAIVAATVVVFILVAAVGFVVNKKKKGGQDAGAYSMSHNTARGSTEQTSLSQS